MKASFKGCADTVKLLLEAGANVNARGKVNEIHAPRCVIEGIIDCIFIALHVIIF